MTRRSDPGVTGSPTRRRLPIGGEQGFFAVRLEQLVLFGPSDNTKIQFGERVTVLAGLGPAERAGMVHTLVEVIAGRLPNASVVFVDSAGRRIFADHGGASCAETGATAASLGELLGADPLTVPGLVTITAADLGLDGERTSESIGAELAAARAALEQVRAEEAEAQTLVVEVDAWRAELAELDRRIASADDDAERWRWMSLRRQLDGLRAELAAIDAHDAEGEAGDARLLDAVDELRSAGEAWAESTQAATELGMELGPLPPVSDADLARVAATPDGLPDDVEERMADLAAAEETRALLEATFAEGGSDPADPGDIIVMRLAERDQAALWRAYDQAVAAERAYDDALTAHEETGEPVVEARIDETHREVERLADEVERRGRPGRLATGLLVAVALLASKVVSPVVGALALVGAVAVAAALLVAPRRALAKARREEEEALAESSAESWLGLHLRRVDEFVNPADRTGLSAAADRRARARREWDDLSGGTSLEAAGARRDAVLTYHQAIDPAARRRREEQALDLLAAARSEAATARAALVAELEPFGLTADAVTELDPASLGHLLEQRSAAGRFARQVLEYQHQLASATTHGAILDRLLTELGFTDGDLAGRLVRAVEAVDAARSRRLATAEVRPRNQVDAEARELALELARSRRPHWELSEEPTEPPADPDELARLRAALAARIAERDGAVDLATMGRRVAAAAERVRSLESEQAAVEAGPLSLRRRLADRIARSTWVGANEENLPILIDDAFAEVEPGELFELLDMVVRLSDRTQIVLLTGSATIGKWARREAEHGLVALLQNESAVI
jgi:hypothetical protein